MRASIWMAALALLVGVGLASLLGFPGPEDRAGDLVSHGRSIYQSLCQRCHGADGEDGDDGDDGDDTSYPGIVPLSGIVKRIERSEIPRLSAPYVGRSFDGEEASALVAFLVTLRGKKSFEEPGSLFSSQLLERKVDLLNSYRVLDVRPKAEFRAGHIPNAIHWDRGETLDLKSELDRLGVPKGAFNVIYDEQGGPVSSSSWWEFPQAGCRKVAVLDGGLQSWIRQGLFVSEVERGATGEKRLPITEDRKPLFLDTTGSPAREIRFEW